eukprot:TRINITY_DN49446_c0_g1_i1.p1 TRINITY_DN49446_c0_g1~~TRINITY_DN49446_c0_g1_i1.p1  ORF type:complete len:220 (-),score=24.99 TRINITY_DN49446_c0_g1_i1:74-733(-)
MTYRFNMAWFHLLLTATICSCNAQTPPSDPFDCETGKANWKLGWSDAKKDWCCKNKQVGCDDSVPPPPPPPTPPPPPPPPPPSSTPPPSPSPAVPHTSEEADAAAERARRLKAIADEEAKNANLFVISEDQSAYVKASLVQSCGGISCDYTGTATVAMNCTRVASCKVKFSPPVSYKGGSTLKALDITKTIATEHKVAALLTGTPNIATVSNYIRRDEL